MDGNIDDIIILIYDTNHLLIAITCRDTDETTEFTDTEIDMNDKVTWLHLLKFLHRQCHLARASSVRP